MRLRDRLAFITLLSIFVLSSTVTAQVLLGSLTGNITDSGGAAVSGAKVEATHLATGQVKTINADSDGSYNFTDLQIGTYKVVISNGGFRTANNERVEITANNVTRFDVKLEVGDVNASVDVTSENDVVLQTDRADINYVHTTRQITDLPLTGSQGRNYQSLLTIVPGAVKDISQSPVANGAGEVNSASGSPQRSISFNVNGVSRLQNNTRVDGASVIYPWLPTNTAYVPITESIQEVNIVTNSFDAEQGLVGGAFTNVITRSGTNGFHGAGWGYMMNSTIGKARNYFQTTPQNPKDILAQYGYAIGGPIFKNKLFFFSDLEKTTRNNTSRINVVSIAPAVLRPGPNGVDFSSAIPVGTNCNITPIAGCIFDPLSNPDPALRTAFPGNIIPANRISSASAALVALLPLPTGPGFQNNFVAGGVATFKRTNFDNKINWTINDRAQIWGKFSYSPTLIGEDPILGEAGGDAVNGGQLGVAPGKVYVFSTGGSYAFSSNVILDWVYGQTLQNLGAEFDLDENYCLDTLHIPGTNGPDRLQGGKCSFQVTNWANMGNPNTGNPFNFYDKQFTQATNLTWTRGDHTFRFGFDYQKQRINHFQPQGGTFQTVRGTFQFNGTSTALQDCNAPNRPDICGQAGTNTNPAAANHFNTWASFLLGLPNAAGKVDQLRNPNSVYFTSYAVYAKDQWRATRDLTINYGIRWERYLRPDKDTTGINWFNPLDGLIYTGGLSGVPDSSYMESGPGWFLPRIGVAYRWNDKTVLRGGYGSSVDPRPFIDFRNAYPIVNAWSMPAVRFAGADNGFIPVTNLVTGLVNTSTAPDLTQGVIKLPPNTGTTTYPRTPKRDLIHSFNFIFERELPWKFKSTVGYVGTRALGQMGFININASAPGTGNNGRPLIGLGINADINEIRPYGDATYDSLQATLNRRWSRSNIGVAYTWSKAINYADNDANPRIQYLPEKERNKGLAGYHREHNLQLYGVYDLPFGKGQPWLNEGGAMNLLVGGWQINTIISAMSGSPFNVVQGTAPALQAAGSGQYPDQIASEINILGGIGVGNPYFDRTVLGVNCTTNCAWGSVGAARFGTAGRNNLIGPAFYNVDFGLFKTFTITERVKFQLRAEALNLFNHANFANPQGDINNSNFGYITSTVGIGERNIRFAGRISF
ncbi:MAG TPA: TonB-dependent receptor [Pyrinomonadaceae bacterium]|nr:TonB-dependent receptor [Pyrinomonadaceae bacterium]